MVETSGRCGDPIAPVAAGSAERRVEVEPGVELRVLDWLPAAGSGGPRLMFVAGWVSEITGWAPVLRAMVERWPVTYIETREKRSAVHAGRRQRAEKFSIERLADDLVEVAAATDGGTAGALWFGSSMGSNAILEALKHGRLPACGAFLIGPNAAFRIPWWGHGLLRLPAASYHVVKHFVIWYVRTFRVDARAEPEQMERYRRTLLTADPYRLKLSARAVAGYRVWPAIETISAPVAIAFAASDSLHGADEARAIAAAIPRGRTIECASNAAMHDRRVVDDVTRFLDELRR